MIELHANHRVKKSVICARICAEVSQVIPAITFNELLNSVSMMTPVSYDARRASALVL